VQPEHFAREFIESSWLEVFLRAARSLQRAHCCLCLRAEYTPTRGTPRSWEQLQVLQCPLELKHLRAAVATLEELCRKKQWRFLGFRWMPLNTGM